MINELASVKNFLPDILLHVFIPHEPHVRMVLQCPATKNMVEVRSVHMQVFFHQIKMVFKGSLKNTKSKLRLYMTVPYLKVMWCHVNQMMEPGYCHVFDVPCHVDHLALLHQVLGLHLHGHVALDHPAASQLGSVNYGIRQESLHHICYLQRLEMDFV